MSGVGRLLNMFKVPDLRNKILFTLLIVLVFRVGSHIPVPYIDFTGLTEWQRSIENNDGGVLGLLNLFAGGAITNVAVFFLGIMPYITASIIMQLLGVVIPKLEEWQNEGQIGQKKITQWTRYVTVALALVQSTGFVFALNSGDQGVLAQSGFGVPAEIDLIPHFTSWKAMLIILTWTAGTAFVMWLGELVTQKGIGNGMSILIFASVVSTIPGQGAVLWQEESAIAFWTLVAIAIFMVIAIIFIESGQRRIPVQFAKRVVGRRMYGGQSSYIPLKVNQSGVIPVIFASSLLSFPALLATVLPIDSVTNFINNNFVGGGGGHGGGGGTSVTWFYILFYGLMIVFFAYFYTAIAFNPAQQADIVRKQGGFIPGIRPGPPTEQYLAKTLNRITLPGSMFLMIVALTPFFAIKFFGIDNFTFAGTALLITVGVALETMKQIDSQLMMRNYEGFLKQ